MSVPEWFGDMRVRNKILLGFVPVLALMSIIALTVAAQGRQLTRLDAESQRVEDVQRAAVQLEVAVADRTLAFRDFLLSGQDTALTMYAEADRRVERYRAEAQGLTRDPVQVARLDSAVTFANDWVSTVATPGIALRRATLQAGGPPLDSVTRFVQSGVGRRGANRVREVLTRFGERESELSAARRGDVRAATSRARDIAVWLTLLGIAVSLGAAWFLANGIGKPLQEAVRFAGGVAEGDLTGQAQDGRRDELGQLTNTLNRMSRDLRAAVGGVNTAAVQTAAAAEQISATSQRMAATVDDQVAATEQTSTSMEEIAAQITRVASSAEPHELGPHLLQPDLQRAHLQHAILQQLRDAQALRARECEIEVPDEVDEERPGRVLREDGRRREVWLAHPMYAEVLRAMTGSMLAASQAGRSSFVVQPNGTEVSIPITTASLPWLITRRASKGSVTMRYQPRPGPPCCCWAAHCSPGRGAGCARCGAAGSPCCAGPPCGSRARFTPR
mgnify:CR=1 FL=1